MFSKIFLLFIFLITVDVFGAQLVPIDEYLRVEKKYRALVSYFHARGLVARLKLCQAKLAIDSDEGKKAEALIKRLWLENLTKEEAACFIRNPEDKIYAYNLSATFLSGEDKIYHCLLRPGMIDFVLSIEDDIACLLASADSITMQEAKVRLQASVCQDEANLIACAKNAHEIAEKPRDSLKK